MIMQLFGLPVYFNEPEGIQYLLDKGVEPEMIEKLKLFGFSGIANMLNRY